MGALFTSSAFSLFVTYDIAFGQDQHNAHIFLFYILWTMDMAINSICLYLNFKFSDGVYKKCCQLCHGQCENLMQFRAAKNIIDDNLSDVIVASTLKIE